MTERKTRIIAIISVIFVGVATSIFFWVAYEVETAGQTLEERVKAIADTNAKEKVYKDLSALVLETKDERAALTSFILNEDETGNFLTHIEQLGAEQGVTLETNSLQVEKQTGGAPDLLNVQFDLEGNEQNVKKMLTIFETLPYHSKVNSFTFERADTLAKSSIGLSVTLLKP